MLRAIQLLRPASLALATLVLVVLATSQPVSAHVLKEDHGISAVLHIPPEDNPKAGTESQLELSFADSRQAFTLNHCRCQVSLKRSEKIIQTAALTPSGNSSSVGTANVNFPVIGNYEVAIAGTATDKSFPAFDLEFPVRVTTSIEGGGLNSKGLSIIAIAAGSLVMLALLAYSVIAAGSRYKPKPN